ncbi:MULTISPECIES: bifunctional UDP-N-acetylglucosamine diphosphorylase/glucosamine-1-phosphate N-acetyltransferase GlmU [Pacificibacter]|uniref:bifunctional UDP-N-acetylglucosamine diphosphorylase/glucosamine-1-phosphate N-acetyltransferase GlmU n=1 Tax=Pacificibacter TaxID=1042323 RepID=UPI001C08E2A4|nr:MULTISPECIES: bifunctional UDP-N-acetylglucosamine diphosphorylase/glucosamine-1-phosphate N-acetyltransferase GlmU [Pacificibacter]MBU2935754.1 bifunctional UDP-N-acetylglucosamine diphosphorylase/glucosamine-1-phosphate N-acetyltransferase GlmU [Pacificibacter marinus]MDO6614250.1 bifunctional UDP-N-acetylglucosamine diphosphorylase/glucosamine-1-phosphate N-acetyltransferase GlmU [Pacificibacter sp. 1_MG-2023]
MATALILLAAGQGSRMNSELPKVLHQIGNAPLFAHALHAGGALDPTRTVIVVGHGADAVASQALSLDEDIIIARQDDQLGTAHAVLQAKEALADFEGDAFVLYGDTPFISAETLEKMQTARTQHDVVVLGFEAAHPGRYGRLVMDGDTLLHIVEFKDATEEERSITLCNSGVLCADAKVLFDLLSEVGNDNAAGEYYLPDVIKIARSKGLSATTVSCNEAETLGVNTRTELAFAESLFQRAKRTEMLENGVTLVAPETVFFSLDTYIGRDAVIDPNVVFGPNVTIESGARIKSFSHLEGCHVSTGADAGPFARLRPGAELGNDAHVGNFVEIKNAQIGEGTKVGHLTYIGDADIGDGANIGAGTITCNYDGVFKHRTTVGRDAFIGSNTMLVAPVTVGIEAMTGSGSVITKDVPNGALAIARAKQDNKPMLAVKLFQRLRALKAKKAEKGQ